MPRRPHTLLHLPNLESCKQHPLPLLLLEDRSQGVATPASSERSRKSTSASSSFGDIEPSLTHAYKATYGQTALPPPNLSSALSLTQELQPLTPTVQQAPLKALRCC